MAPVATNDTVQDQVATGPVKNGGAPKLFNPFYSPTNGSDGNDGDYKYANYKVSDHARFIWMVRIRECFHLLCRMMPAAVLLAFQLYSLSVF